MTATTVSTATLGELADEIDRVMAGALGDEPEVAFVNFPNIANPGDSLLWLGARAALARRRARIALVCEPATYHRGSVRRAVGDRGLVLLAPGGNLGDLYPRSPHQALREQVLRDFPHARIVQLPQSLYFQRPRRARRFARLAGRHGSFTLLLREHDSVERAEALGLPSTLCPDLGFALTSAADLPPGGPGAGGRDEVLWIARRGAESLHGPPAGRPGLRVGDFPIASEQRAGRSGFGLAAELRLNRALVRGAARGGRTRRPLAALAARRYERLARLRVALATGLLGRARTIVTDRYHAHVIALLLGIPHVLLDNVYGKNRALHDAWSSRFELTHWSDTASAAERLAFELATVGRAS